MVPYRFLKKEVGNLILKNVFISLLVKYFNTINNIESLTIFESYKLEIKADRGFIENITFTV